MHATHGSTPKGNAATIYRALASDGIRLVGALANEIAKASRFKGRSDDNSSCFRAHIFVVGSHSMLRGPAATWGDDMSCSGPMGGGRTVTNGNVTVSEGRSCTLSFVNITGNVRVESEATLIGSAYTRPSEVGADIEPKNCKSVLLQGNVTVGGDLNIVSAGGNLSCEGNSPAVTRSHGPSWVDGHSRRQCAGFSTSRTSIGTAVTPTPCANLATLPAWGFPVPNTVIVEQLRA
jgi:hypothetical protein